MSKCTERKKAVHMALLRMEPNLIFGEALVTSQIKDVSLNGVCETTDSDSCAMFGVEVFLLYYISFPFWLGPCKGSLFLAEA
jgi:hypothetical protein